MLGEAIKYPMNRDDWIKQVLIGGLLIILSFLFVPILVVYGYLVQVLRARANGEPTPPVFDDWGDLLVDGLKWFVISLAYGIPSMILFVIVMAVGGSAIFMAGTNTGSSTAAGGLFLVLILLYVVVSIVIGYFATAAIVNFAVEDSLGAAFDFGTVFGVATTGAFFVGWLKAILVMAAAGILIFVVLLIPILGLILVFLGGAFYYFYVLVVFNAIIADAFAEATM